VYATSVYGKGTYGFNARTGAKVWSYPDGSYTPVIADQNALILMGKYTLYKFDKSGK
jgi:outer membrane protein assembly factor BamB